MKKIALSSLASVVLSLSAHAQFVDLISLGTSGIGAADLIGASLTQDATGVTVNGSVAQNDNFYNSSNFSPQNWSTSQGLWIKSSVTTAAIPALSFTMNLFDSSFAIIGSYQGNTATSTSADGFTYFGQLTAVGTPTLTGITGLQINFDTGTNSGAGTANPNMQMLAVSTIPEPSTYALMALGGLVFFFIARRRKAQV